jgi:hypothetical protein
MKDARLVQSAFSDLAIDPMGWAPYLADGEVLLWEGRPSPRIRFELTVKNLLLTVFGTIFASFALAIFYTHLVEGDWGGVLFAVPFVLMALFLLVGRHWWDSYRRAKTRYALTDRRALIARALGRRVVESHVITHDARIDLIPGVEATVLFAAEVRQDQRGRAFQVRHGFEMIPDGERVARLLYRIQAAAKRAEPVNAADGA